MCCLSTAFEERSIRKGKPRKNGRSSKAEILQSLHLKRTPSAASAERRDGGTEIASTC